MIATNNLRDTAARLEDGIVLLKDFATEFKNNSCTKTRREQMASVIKNLIIPLQETSVVLLKNAAPHRI